MKTWTKPAVREQEVGALGAVHGAAPAEPDDQIDATVAARARRVLDRPRRWILGHVEKGDDRQSEAFEAAARPRDVTRLRDAIVGFFAKELVEGELFLPYDRQHLRGELFSSCEVLEENYDERGAVILARAHPDTFARLRSLLSTGSP